MVLDRIQSWGSHQHQRCFLTQRMKKALQKACDNAGPASPECTALTNFLKSYKPCDPCPITDAWYSVISRTGWPN
mgnify:CR=1 FL=1